jgi:hypothetical protein
MGKPSKKENSLGVTDRHEKIRTLQQRKTSALCSRYWSYLWQKRVAKDTILAAYDYKWKTRLEVFYTHGSPVINEEIKNINHKATKAQSFLSKNFNHLVSWWLRGEISQ